MALTRQTGSALPGSRSGVGGTAPQPGEQITRMTGSGLSGARYVTAGGAPPAIAAVGARVIDILSLHPMNRGLRGGTTYE